MWSGSFLHHLHCHGAWHGVSDSRTIIELYERRLETRVLVRLGKQPKFSTVSLELILPLNFIQYLFTGPLLPAPSQSPAYLSCSLLSSHASHYSFKCPKCIPTSGSLSKLFPLPGVSPSCPPGMTESLSSFKGQLKCLFFRKDVTDHPISSLPPPNITLDVNTLLCSLQSTSSPTIVVLLYLTTSYIL